MHKIIVSGDIGTLEWTPPTPLQQKFNSVPVEVAEEMKKWMGRLIEGYVCALLDTQRTTAGLKWLEEQTIRLVTETLSLQSASPKTPPPRRLN